MAQSNGKLNSILLTALEGTFTFIAGHVARSNRLWIDTPFERFRSSARVGGQGFGFITLAAFTFALLKEAQAANPDNASWSMTT